MIQTYSPLLLVCIRAVVFCVVFENIGLVVHSFRTVCFVTFFIVFLDQYVFIADNFNQKIMFLYPVHMMLVLDKLVIHTRPPECADFAHIVSTFVTDILWAILSNVFVLNVSMNFINKPRVFTAMSIFLLCIHTITHCSTNEWWLMFVRIVVFYLCNFLMYHAPAFVREDRDNNEEHEAKCCLCFYVSLHILFVHVYVLMGSVVALFGVFWHMFSGHNLSLFFIRTKGETENKKTDLKQVEHKFDLEHSGDLEEIDLMEQFQQAKRQSVQNL